MRRLTSEIINDIGSEPANNNIIVGIGTWKIQGRTSYMRKKHGEEIIRLLEMSLVSPRVACVDGSGQAKVRSFDKVWPICPNRPTPFSPSYPKHFPVKKSTVKKLSALGNQLTGLFATGVPCGGSFRT